MGRRLLRARFVLSFVALMLLVGCSEEDDNAETAENGPPAAGTTDEREPTAKRSASKRLIGTWNLDFVYDQDSAQALFDAEGIAASRADRPRVDDLPTEPVSPVGQAAAGAA